MKHPESVISRSHSGANGDLYLLLATVLWSTGGVFIKFIPWSPISINCSRCLVALFITLLLSRSARRFVHPSPAAWIAGLCFSLTALSLTIATKYTSAANAILLQHSSPLFIIFYTVCRFRRFPRIKELLCTGCIAFGLFLCFEPSNRTQNMGNAIALLSGVFFAGMFIANATPSAQPQNATILGYILGGVIGIPSLVHETVWNIKVIVLILILGCVQFGLAYACFSIGIQRTSALNANLISMLEPILNPIWVSIFYGEIISVRAILGGGIILLASIIYTVLPLFLSFIRRNEAHNMSFKNQDISPVQNGSPDNAHPCSLSEQLKTGNQETYGSGNNGSDSGLLR